MPLPRLLPLPLAFVGALGLALPAARAGEPQCGPHEHVVTERDEDEGSLMKRCVCDEGWDADGPGKPCRAPVAPAAGNQAPAKGAPKGKKSPRTRGK